MPVVQQHQEQRKPGTTKTIFLFLVILNWRTDTSQLEHEPVVAAAAAAAITTTTMTTNISEKKCNNDEHNRQRDERETSGTI